MLMPQHTSCSLARLSLRTLCVVLLPSASFLRSIADVINRATLVKVSARVVDQTESKRLTWRVVREYR